MALLRYLVIHSIQSIPFLPTSFKLEGKESGGARKCIRVYVFQCGDSMNGPRLEMRSSSIGGAAQCEVRASISGQRFRGETSLRREAV